MSRLARGAVAYCLAVLFTTGCSSNMQIGDANPPGKLNANEEAILHVGLAYREASTALRKGPAGVKDLKPYLKQYGDPDQLLISPNDGQPYQITWGIIPMHPPRNFRFNPFLVYEQTGKDGKRYALDFRLKVRHLTDKEFQSLGGSNPGGNVSPPHAERSKNLRGSDTGRNIPTRNANGQ